MTIKPTWPNDFVGLEDGSVCFPTTNPPVPPNDLTADPHLTVLGLVSDPRIQLEDEPPSWELVAYWPHRRTGQWTVTHQGPRDIDASDYPATVLVWMPLPPVPPPSDLGQTITKPRRDLHLTKCFEERQVSSIGTKTHYDEPILSIDKTIPLETETIRRIFGTTARAWADTPLGAIGLAA